MSEGTVAKRVVGRPLTSERAREIAEQRWAKERERNADRFGELNPSEQKIELRKAMVALGITNANELAAMDDDVTSILLTAVIRDHLLRIAAGEVAPKTSGEAIKVVEAALKMQRLIEGKATEIVEDEAALRSKVQDMIRRQRESKAG